MKWRFHLCVAALIASSATLLSTTDALAMLGGVGPEGERAPGREDFPSGCDSPPPQPVITSISPASGPIGTTVIISGQNLLGTGILVNGVPDLSFTSGGSNTNTTKTATIPPGATTGHITAFMPPSPTSNCPLISSTPTEADIFTVRLVSLSSCCNLIANAALKGRLGRLVVAFPAGANPTGTRIAVFKDGKEVRADYGSQSFELLPGTYEVKIAGKVVPSVTVKAGHDTSVKAGVLRITGAKNVRAAVLEGGHEIAGAYGGELIGLPAGSFDIQMAGQTEKVTINEGKITDF